MSTPVYVGTAGFGAEDPHVVLKLQMAHSDGRLSVAGEPTKTNGQNPGWVLVTRAGTNARLTAYVAMEDDNGTVQAFGIDPSEPATLSARGEPVSTTGRHPCYLDISRDRRWLFAANYSSGSVAVLRINEDGSVGPSTDSKGMQGGESIDPALADRQEMAHCHCIVAHPGGKWVAVCDLGLSTVFIYELDTVRGSLVGAASDGRHLRLEAGAGCRHACWSHDGNRLFINNELTCTITVADFNVESGNLQERQTISCLPPGVEGTRAPHRGNSDIHLHPNGKFLYAGVRSPEPGFIAIFGVRDVDGFTPLTVAGHESTQGLVPRNFKLVPGEHDAVWLVVGNQESKTVVSFGVDNGTGALHFASKLSTEPYKACNISYLVA